jgi:hypothetical protein
MGCALCEIAFWDVAPCSLVEGARHFRGAYCLSGWWWRQYASLKYRSTPTRLHGATSQKTLIFMRFEVLTTFKMSMLFFWLVTSCGSAIRYQRTGAYYSKFLRNVGILPASPWCCSPEEQHDILMAVSVYIWESYTLLQFIAIRCRR